MDHITPEVQILLAMGAPSAVGVLGWWLSGRFRKIELAYRDSLDELAVKNQQRHEENLVRFGKIERALAVLGYRNGNS